VPVEAWQRPCPCWVPDLGTRLTCDNSAAGGTRTPDLLVRSQLLYPLSYSRILLIRSQMLYPLSYERGRTPDSVRHFGVCVPRQCRPPARRQGGGAVSVDHSPIPKPFGNGFLSLFCTIPVATRAQQGFPGLSDWPRSGFVRCLRRRPNATIALAGLSHHPYVTAADLSATNRQLVLGNQVIFGTVNAGRQHYLQAAEALAKADPGWLASLITRQLPMQASAEALTKEPDDIKVTVALADS
jgi:hypothetical protein